MNKSSDNAASQAALRRADDTPSKNRVVRPGKVIARCIMVLPLRQKMSNRGENHAQGSTGVGNRMGGGGAVVRGGESQGARGEGQGASCGEAEGREGRARPEREHSQAVRQHVQIAYASFTSADRAAAAVA